MSLSKRLLTALAANTGDDPGILTSDAVYLGDETRGRAAAAVLIAIVDRPAPGILLTVRNANMRSHPGQVAFPGGRVDPDDDGAVGAALREAEEEIGLPRTQVEVVGAIDPYLTGSGYLITPVIGVVPPDLALVPHDAEVADWFEVPVAHLLASAHQVRRTMEWRGREITYYEIMWGQHRIWGATAAILVNLRRRLGASL